MEPFTGRIVHRTRKGKPDGAQAVQLCLYIIVYIRSIPMARQTKCSQAELKSSCFSLYVPGKVGD